MADLKKLQRLIDTTAKLEARAHAATRTLCEFCREAYGAEPGDLDADEIIDAVMGGCGEPTGMSAARFDEVMRELTRSRP